MADINPDLKLGELLVRRGLADPEKMKTLLAKQAELRHKGQKVSLGKLCVDEGLVTRETLQEILKQQSSSLNIPGYEILSKLGEGGMGAVYRARQTSMNRLVALKVLPKKLAANSMFIKRFIREARTAARLNHPNVITAIDVGEHNGVHYFAMEFVPGCTLKNLMESKGPLNEAYAVHVISQICLGLEHATREGIIHRDIKPDNILLTSAYKPKEDETPETGLMEDVAKIADMGLAKYQDEDQTMITQAGATLGTPHYISPEQALGEQDIDFRADIYSLGATYYHMVTGKTPFQGSTVGQIVTAHISKPLHDPREARPELSEGCAKVILRMMQKKRENRYASHQELLADLHSMKEGRKVAAKPVGAASDTLIVDPGTMPLQTAGAAWALRIVPVVLLVASVVYFAWDGNEDVPSPPIPSTVTQQEIKPPPTSILTARSILDRLISEELPEQTCTSRIHYWREAVAEFSSFETAEAAAELVEVRNREEKARKDLESFVKEAQSTLEARLKGHVDSLQWLQGALLISGWAKELEMILPNEDLLLSGVADALPPERAYWGLLRSKLDADLAKALETSSMAPLEAWKQTPLPELRQGENTLALQGWVASRVQAVEASLASKPRLEARNAEARALTRWDPLDDISVQLSVLSALEKEGGSLRTGIGRARDILDEALAAEEALLEACSNLKGSTQFTGKGPSKKTWRIAAVDKPGRTIRVEDDEGLHLGIGQLPSELMRRILVQAKLPSNHRAHAKPDSLFRLLLAHGRLDEAASWLADPPEDARLADETSAHAAWRLSAALRRWGAPCTPLPEGALHFCVDCGSSTRFRTLLWEGPSGTTLETDARGFLHLKGHTLSFKPTVEISAPWSLGISCLPFKGSSLDIVMECGLEKTRIALGFQEGRTEISSRGEIQEARKFEAPLSLPSVPLDVRVRMEMRDGHPHAVLELQGRETTSIRLGSTAGALRVRVHSAGWALGSIELDGVPRIP